MGIEIGSIGEISGGNTNFIGTQITNLPLVQTCPTPPPAPDHFGGRDIALKTLCRSLKDGKTSAITAMYGLGGIGKTTLALQTANVLFKDKTFRAVLWANVTREPDPMSILEGWARHADPKYVRPDNPKLDDVAAHVKAMLDASIDKTCEHCEPPRILVVLDDVWSDPTKRGLAAARTLRKACPDGSTILVTTRSEELAIDFGATPQKLDRLTPNDGAALLKTYKALAKVPKSDLKVLSEALGGHALALSLAARRIQKADDKSQALRDHIAEYQTQLPLGTEFKNLELDQGEAREDNLTTVLSYSYADLSPDDQGRFRALGILPPDVPFDLHILVAIWGVEENEAKKYLNALRLASLLESDPSSKGWYRQHRLLRAYALALLKNADEAEPVFAHYADHTNGIAANFNDLPPDQWGKLTSYLPHIRSVGSTLVTKTQTITPDTDEALLRQAQRFAYNMTWYLYHRREDRHIEWSEMGLRVSKALKDEKLQSRFLNDLGLVYNALGDKRQALDYYAQALPIQRAVGDKSGEATTLNNIGMVYDALGDKRQALDYYEQALPIRRAVGDKSGEATTLNNIGLVYHSQGDLDKAIEYVARCVELDEQVEHPDLESDRRMLEQLKRQRDGSTSAAQTLPDDTINTLSGNTIAVKTSASDKLTEWRAALQSIRADFAQNGDDWQIEVAFVDALLAILDDQPVTLPASNPYHAAVQQVIAAIADYRKES
ncbi:MAG: tetratricopeptide repeat protein [Anaerolineae bacterium]|nr:tetratricopeptide repeat protein [Anaerolineae bacterium]